MRRSTGLSRTTPWLVLLAPVAYVAVGAIVQALPWLGPPLSLAAVLAVAAIVRNASIGAVHDAAFERDFALPAFGDSEAVEGLLHKGGQWGVGICILAFSYVVVGQMSFEGDATSRGLSAIGSFLAVAITAALLVSVVRRMVDDDTARTFSAAGGIVAVALIIYLIAGLYRSGDPVKRELADMRASGGKLEKIDLNARNADGETTFMQLVQNQHTTEPAQRVAHRDRVVEMISRGADIHARDAQGRTLLTYAVQSGNPLVVDLFLERGLDPSVRDNNGWTPFAVLVSKMASAESQILDNKGKPVSWLEGVVDFQLLERFIAKGADVNDRGRDRMPLISEAVWGPKVFEFLIGKGADPAVTGPYGRSIWSEMRTMPAERVLLIADPLPEIPAPKLDDGKPAKGPLHVFAERGDVLLVEYFLKRGVDPKAVDEYGNTPLHSLGGGEANARRIVELLLAAGADIDARTASGATPLMHATRQPAAIARLMIERGANFNAVAETNFMHHVNNRSTALDWYIQSGNREGAEILRAAGARTLAERGGR